MKFGEHLQKNIFEPWRNEYIQYDKLKHFLKERQLSFTGWMETDEDYFLEKLVSVEIDKVFEFINLKLRQIDSRLLDLQTSTGTKTEYEAELTKIGELSRFIELNNTGAQKIIKKHDKWTHIDLSQHSKIRKSFQKFKTYQFRVGQLRNDINRRSLLIDFSTDIEVLPPSKKEETPSFTTSNYWIHPDHINEVQAILLFHLQKKSENATIKPTHAVYFDNSSQFPLYSGLIQRKECAETLCFKG
jgi:SPX domain protein involved in polyphosphate accumulation